MELAPKCLLDMVDDLNGWFHIDYNNMREMDLDGLTPAEIEANVRR